MTYELGQEVTVVGRIVGVESEPEIDGNSFVAYDHHAARGQIRPTRLTVLVEQVITPPDRGRSGTVVYQPWHRQQKLEVEL